MEEEACIGLPVMEKKTYLDLPVFRVLFDSIRNDPEPQRSVSMKGLGTALLADYFPTTNGWVITQSSIQAAGSVVLRVQHYLHTGDDGRRPARIPDHLLACVVHDTQDWKDAMEELDELSAERWNIENGCCWVMVFHGLEVYFFCYRHNRSFGERYAGCGTRFFQEGEEIIQNRYHLQSEGALVHQIMVFMASCTDADTQLRIIRHVR
ncbi:hypothetical protein BDW75DRAFT_95786 [Aspergillus navahoensis]